MRHVIKDVKEEPKREAIIRAYTSDFIHSFPLGMKKTVIKNEDGSVIFCQRFLEYEGTVIWFRYYYHRHTAYKEAGSDASDNFLAALIIHVAKGL